MSDRTFLRDFCTLYFLKGWELCPTIIENLQEYLKIPRLNLFWWRLSPLIIRRALVFSEYVIDMVQPLESVVNHVVDAFRVGFIDVYFVLVSYVVPHDRPG